MSDTLRGVALLLSLAMWSPVAGGLLRGDVGLERALLLYAAAAAIALAGCSLLAGLVRAYTPVPGPGEAEPAGTAADGAGRRGEDAPDR